MKRILNDSDEPICLTALLEELTRRELSIRGEVATVKNWRWNIRRDLIFAGREAEHYLVIRLPLKADDHFADRVRSKRQDDWRLHQTAAELGIDRERVLHVGRAHGLDVALRSAIHKLGGVTLESIGGKPVFKFKTYGECELLWVDEENQTGRYVIIKKEEGK